MYSFCFSFHTCSEDHGIKKCTRGITSSHFIWMINSVSQTVVWTFPLHIKSLYSSISNYEFYRDVDVLEYICSVSCVVTNIAIEPLWQIVIWTNILWMLHILHQIFRELSTFLAHCTKVDSFKNLNGLLNTKIYVCVFVHIISIDISASTEHQNKCRNGGLIFGSSLVIGFRNILCTHLINNQSGSLIDFLQLVIW